MEGTKREGHEGNLAGWRILGVGRVNRKVGQGEIHVLIGRTLSSRVA